MVNHAAIIPTVISTPSVFQLWQTPATGVWKRPDPDATLENSISVKTDKQNKCLGKVAYVEYR